jgi:subtilisin-like proprotein convertase family protein
MTIRGLVTCSVLVVGATLLSASPADSVASVRTTVTQDEGTVVTTLDAGAQGSLVSLPEVGAATPYPDLSDNFDGRGGTVADVDVTLHLSHARVSDLDVLLVAPDGRQATLMSDVGGGAGADVTLTLDDEADFSLPENGSITSGTYQATNYGTDDTYPSPAPQPTGSTALSVFDGSPVQGAWRLFAVDDTGGVSGFISGWSLVIGRTPRPYPSTVVVGGDVGTITDLDVHLTGLAMPSPQALDLMLVGPQGQRTTIFSEAGDPTTSKVDLVLDDEAVGRVPQVSPLVSGRYRPTNYGASDFFPPPAPPDTGTADLSVFDGTDPRGTWQLYGWPTYLTLSRLDGWSLDIEWTDATGPTGSVTVAGGQPVVTDPTVALGLAATDPAPGTPVARMRFSNDGLTWSAYQPFASSAAWTLPAGDGTRTVYAQFEDAAGNPSAVTSDTIRLDTDAPRAVKVRPATTSKAVRRTATVTVTVSEAIDHASVTRKSVVLKRVGRPGRVRSSVGYDAAKNRIVLDPRRKLAADARYRVTVTTNVVDLVGHAWDQSTGKAGSQALTWTFRTR